MSLSSPVLRPAQAQSRRPLLGLLLLLSGAVAGCGGFGLAGPQFAVSNFIADGFVSIGVVGGPVQPLIRGLNLPAGAVYGPGGDLYVANQGGGTVLRIDVAGRTSVFAGGLQAPYGIAFSPAGDCYVTNQGDGSIAKVTPDGAVTTFAGDFGAPTGLLYLADGSLVIVDNGGTRPGSVLRLGPDGSRTTLASGIPDANGVAIDTLGRYYVASGSGNAVLAFTPDGTRTPPLTPVVLGLRNPNGVTAAPDGGIYVADSGNDDILKYVASGEVSVIAAGFATPYAVAFR